MMSNQTGSQELVSPRYISEQLRLKAVQQSAESNK